MLPTPLPPQTVVFPPDGWLTKKITANRLDLTVEGVRNLVRNGTLRTKRQRNPESNQVVTLIHEGDVERERWRRKHPDEIAGKPNPSPQAALPAPEESEEEAVEGSPWLSLTDAGKRIGLSAACVKRYVLNGALRSVDVGGDAPRFRVHRDELDAFRGTRYEVLTPQTGVPGVRNEEAKHG